MCGIGGQFLVVIGLVFVCFFVVVCWSFLPFQTSFASTQALRDWKQQLICRNKSVSDLSSHSSFALCSLQCTHDRAHEGPYRVSSGSRVQNILSPLAPRLQHRLVPCKYNKELKAWIVSCFHFLVVYSENKLFKTTSSSSFLSSQHQAQTSAECDLFNTTLL